MTSFILPNHANAQVLQKMLRHFRNRLQKESYGAEQVSVVQGGERVTLELLQSIKTEQDKVSEHYVLYWPLQHDPYQTKRCIIQQQQHTHNLHVIPITSLILKIHPTMKNRFMPCECVDHSKRVRLNWREFIYPQFVDLLFRRLQLPSNCPSPSVTNAYCVLNEKLHFSMEIDRHALFLRHVGDDLFRVPCRDLYVKHKNRHLDAFGKENIEGWCHFKETHMNDTTHKLFFKLSNARIRATRIMGGGRVHLKATGSSSIEYVFFASNFYLLPTNDKPHYKIYVMAPEKQHAILAHHEKRRINSSKLCPDHSLCMIVSSSALTLEFKEGGAGCFILATPAVCKMALGSDYMLSLWTRDHRYAWPLKYEVIQEEEKSKNIEKFYARIRACYDVLFNDPPFCTEQMLTPAHGYTLFWDEDEVVGCLPTGESISQRLIKHRLLDHNQYGSMIAYRNETHQELRTLRLYYKKPDDVDPTPPPGMHIIHEEHYVHGSLFKLRGLRRQGEHSAWCYFFVNREKTYIVFIPLTQSV